MQSDFIRVINYVDIYEQNIEFDNNFQLINLRYVNNYEEKKVRATLCVPIVQ